MIDSITHLVYLAATVLFILSLHWMNDPKTARRSVSAGAAAMLLAIVATWFQPGIIHHAWIIFAIALGFIVGILPNPMLPASMQVNVPCAPVAAFIVGTVVYFICSKLGMRSAVVPLPASLAEAAK